MSETYTPISRRQFCTGACHLAAGASLATIVAGCGGGSSPTSPGGSMGNLLGVSNGQFTGAGVHVSVAGSALADVGGAVLVQSTAGVFLLARVNSSAFSAIDAVCSHESCTITGADGNTYVCQCHGSRYNRNGQVLAGPARAALRQFPTTFNDGIVTIAL